MNTFEVGSGALDLLTDIRYLGWTSPRPYALLHHNPTAIIRRRTPPRTKTHRLQDLGDARQGSIYPAAPQSNGYNTRTPRHLALPPALDQPVVQIPRPAHVTSLTTANLF